MVLVTGMTGTLGEVAVGVRAGDGDQEVWQAGAAGDFRPGQGLFELDPDGAAERLAQFRVSIGVEH